jgi:hypothetical protein
MLVKDTKMHFYVGGDTKMRFDVGGDTKMRFDVGGDTNIGRGDTNMGRGHQHGRGEAIKQCHSGGNLLKYSI